MTKWHDPSVERAENIAGVKFKHVICGLYLWEFFWSLRYEYSIITRRRKFTLSFLPYVTARWLTFALVFIEFLDFDSSVKISCQADITIGFAFGALSLLCASVMVILRAIGLWEQRKFIIAICSALWLVNASVFVYGVSTFHAHTINGTCAFVHKSSANIIMLSTFSSDIILLSLMLVGLLRWRNSRRRGGIWWILYTQGLAWVVIYTLAGLPTVIFIVLDLNDPMIQMFLVPEIVSMTICASRMHLGLSEALYGHPSTRVLGDSEQQSGMGVQFPVPPHRRYVAERIEMTKGQKIAFTGNSQTDTTLTNTFMVQSSESESS